MSIESLFEGIKPIPPDVREAFRGTEFSCECGGVVFPQSMDKGICFSCKEEVNLEDCDYETLDASAEKPDDE